MSAPGVLAAEREATVGREGTAAHPLDRPVRGALDHGWAALALNGDGGAARLDPDHGPFAASADLSPAGLAGLSTLPFPDRETWVVETAPVDAPAGTQVVARAAVAQMLATDMPRPTVSFGWRVLGEEDAPEMLALARLTRPGPFEISTHRLGHFIGAHEKGRLVAMAGERMRMPGFVEVSGVCTHPDHRGRGYAGGLMRLVASRIVAAGSRPFLHAYADHADTIALYEGMGFRVRRQMALTILARRR